LKIGKFMRKCRKQFRYGEKGFTLVELLIVVAILGILAALIIPNVTTFLESGKVGAGRAETKVIQVSVDGMMADAGVTAITARTDWPGTAGHAQEPTATSSGGTSYQASDYFRRSITPNSTWSVDATGVVTCTEFDGDTDATFLARINE
jgi:prepilin-type N-terminal cleavage/methylation domain-containing protein